MDKLTAAQIDALPFWSIIEERSRLAGVVFPLCTVYIRKHDGWRGTHGGIASSGAVFRGEDVYLIREGGPE